MFSYVLKIFENKLRTDNMFLQKKAVFKIRSLGYYVVGEDNKSIITQKASTANAVEIFKYLNHLYVYNLIHLDWMYNIVVMLSFKAINNFIPPTLNKVSCYCD